MSANQWRRKIFNKSQSLETKNEVWMVLTFLAALKSRFPAGMTNKKARAKDDVYIRLLMRCISIIRKFAASLKVLKTNDEVWMCLDFPGGLEKQIPYGNDKQESKSEDDGLGSLLTSLFIILDRAKLMPKLVCCCKRIGMLELRRLQALRGLDKICER